MSSDKRGAEYQPDAETQQVLDSSEDFRADNRVSATLDAFCFLIRDSGMGRSAAMEIADLIDTWPGWTKE